MRHVTTFHKTACIAVKRTVHVSIFQDNCSYTYRKQRSLVGYIKVKRYFNHSDGSVLAKYLDAPAGELARTFQADEVRLLRLLPYLPTLLLLQEVVNGLVTHTAETMTMQGWRTRLVR